MPTNHNKDGPFKYFAPVASNKNPMQWTTPATQKDRRRRRDVNDGNGRGVLLAVDDVTRWVSKTRYN